MTLKRKLFLVFGGLMALLMLTQWWLVRRISENTVEEFAEATIEITQQMVEFFNQELLRNPKPGDMVKVIRTDSQRTVERIERRLEHETGEGGSGLPVQALQEPAVVHDFQLKAGQHPSQDGPTAGQSDPSMSGFEIVSRLEFPEAVGTAGSRMLAIRVAGPGAEKEITVSSDQLSSSMRQFRTQLMLGTALILVVGLTAAGLLANRITQPLRELSSASTAIAAGNWGRQVEQSGTAELEDAIDAFNHMSRELQLHVEAQKNWQQEKHLSDLGEVARSLAHTIRNPLNALGLCLEELGNRSPRDAESEELIRGGRLQIQRIDHWIRSFLSLASQSTSISETVRWQPLIEDIVLELAQTGGQNPIELDQSFESLPPIQGNETEIRGMLQTLLANAVEASPAESAIQIRGRATDDRIQIEVEDRGSGISEETRKNLFAPHITTKVNGSGMGLYLSRQIVKTRYQGDLELRDRAGGGIRAVLTLSRTRR